MTNQSFLPFVFLFFVLSEHDKTESFVLPQITFFCVSSLIVSGFTSRQLRVSQQCAKHA